MIILDTNVISALMREKPDNQVKEWIARQKVNQLYLTIITIAEIQRELARLPVGKRRTRLETHFSRFLRAAFAGRILPLDEDAAWLYGDIAANREKAGFHVDAVDLMIVAIAKNHDAKIATSNVKDFHGCEIELINPWLLLI